MNFILFSGPPRAGKDTGAKIAHDYIQSEAFLGFDPIWEKFSFPNKRAFAGMMGLTCDQWGTVTPHEATKDEVIPYLGFSYRQWQISFSETYMKPLYGSDIFGRLLIERCHIVDGTFDPVFVVSDCGFQVEVDHLADHNVLLFQMGREGATYAGDSRGPIKPAFGWTSIAINNSGPVEELQHVVELNTKVWLNGL